MLSFYFQLDTARNSPDDSDQEPAEIVVEQPATSEVFVIWRVPSLASWWRHQMETFSALLALCAGSSPVPVNSPHKGALMFSFIYARINDWVNNREAGDLRRQDGHYDVIVMFWWQINALSYYSLDQMTSCTYSLFDEKLKLGYSDLPRSHSGCRLNALLVNTFKTEIISLKSDESVPSDRSFAEQHQPPNTKTQQPCSMLSFYFQSDTARNSPDDSGQEATEIVTKQLAMSEVCVIEIHRYGMFPHLHFNDKSTFYLTTRNWRPYK